MAKDTICTGAKLTALADTIRAKANTEGAMTLDEMAEVVEGISVGGGGVAAVVGRSLTSIPEAETITVVGEYAFARCGSLAGEVSLPNVEVIWHSAFDRCDAITAISAPKCRTLYTLGSCANLEHLYLPKIELCMNQFQTPKLRELRLPECTDFRGRMYGGTTGCASLTRVWLPKATTLPTDGSNTSLADGVATLVSISLDAATNVHAYTYGNPAYLIKACAALTSLNMPSVTTLGGYVLINCTSLTSLYLPSCTQIDYRAIGSGTPIDTLVLPGATLCRLTGSLNSALPIAQGTGHVYVPESLVSAYQAASNWSSYAAQFRAIEDWPEVVEAARLNALSAIQGWDE